MSTPFYADHAALPGDLKRANQQHVLSVLRSGRTMTAPQIHEETGISRPTVMRALQHYCEKGVVESLGLGSTTSLGGKKPELFRFADRERFLCAHVSSESITLALSGMLGDVYAVEQIHARTGKTADEVAATLAENVPAYLKKQDVSAEELFGVVLTTNGKADAALEEKLKDLFGAKVFLIQNAGKAAGRAMMMQDPAYAGMRLLTLSTSASGVSACLLDRGRDLLAGDIGHMAISDRGPVCSCGRRGCFESLISAQNARQLMQGLQVNGLRDLFQQAASGESTAKGALRYLAGCFASVIHNVSLCFALDAVVIQGDYAQAGAAFDKMLRDALGQETEVVYERQSLSVLAVQGAAENMKERYFEMAD